MRLVYVAGPFSAPTREGVEANIRRAERVGLEVAKLGAMPVIPHANTGHPDFELAQPYEFWIDGTMELLRRCDAIVMVRGWEQSSGARGEHADAMRSGMPVFFEERIGELEAWLASRCAPVEPRFAVEDGV